MTPYEIIAAPFTAWIAPVGTAFPNIDANPAAAWLKLGASGPRNVSEDGVSVSHPQKIELLRTLGSTGPIKAFRTEEDLMLSFTLFDLTLEMYRKALNDLALTNTPQSAGVAGNKSLPMHRGSEVAVHALLLRGPSAYDEALNLDYRIPKVVHSGEPELVFKKGEPAGVLMEFQALEDIDYAAGKFGEIVMQTSVAG